MGETTAAVAYEARNLAESAHEKIDGHEKLCAERYGNINSNLSMLFKIIGWGGSTTLLLLLALLGWLGNRVVDSIDASNQQLRDQIEAVRTQQPGN